MSFVSKKKHEMSLIPGVLLLPFFFFFLADQSTWWLSEMEVSWIGDTGLHPFEKPVGKIMLSALIQV